MGWTVVEVCLELCLFVPHKSGCHRGQARRVVRGDGKVLATPVGTEVALTIFFKSASNRNVGCQSFSHFNTNSKSDQNNQVLQSTTKYCDECEAKYSMYKSICFWTCCSCLVWYSKILQKLHDSRSKVLDVQEHLSLHFFVCVWCICIWMELTAGFGLIIWRRWLSTFLSTWFFLSQYCVHCDSVSC